MAKATRARAIPPNGGLPDEIVFWEILIRLPPKFILRCRSVCRAWHRLMCARDFLLAHHDRQPSLPIFSGDDKYIFYPNMRCIHYHNILAFDYRATTVDGQLHAVAQLDEAFNLEGSCDGLLVLSNFKWEMMHSSPRLSICNPATREHAPLGIPRDLDILGMYLHRPTSEYRLLLQRSTCKIQDWGPEHIIGCHVFALGSDQPPRYIGKPEMAMGSFKVPARMRDSLHWYPVRYHSAASLSMYESKVIVVFDTIAESFRQMRAPLNAPTDSFIFEIDGTLSIHSRSYAMEIIDIWVLQNYGTEVWNLKYRIKLPVAKIRREFENSGDRWDLSVVSADCGVLLLLKGYGWVIHVDSDGKLVNHFYCRQGLYMSRYLLKQSLVQHNFFHALKDYGVNSSPFIGPVE